MQTLPELAFIITRHISNISHKDMWKECIRCIRKHYMDAPIIIVDDKSDQTLIEPFEDHEISLMQNVKIIQSEFPGAGELLAYYYYHKLRPLQKACILHDTMFIQKPFEDNTIKTLSSVKYLWEFPAYCTPVFDKKNNEYVQEQHDILCKLNYSFEIIDHFFSFRWKGCFGVASLITLEFLDKLQNKYHIFNMLPYIRDRDDRQVSERSFGIIATYELKQNNSLDLDNISVFGDISANNPNAFKYSFDDYMSQARPDMPIIKCWSGR